MTGTLETRPAYPPAPVRKRESEAPVPRAFRSARRNRHVSVPLAVPPAMWAAGEIMHAFAVAPEAAIGGAVLAGSVWFFAPHKWTGKDGKPRRPEVRYARASAIGGASWLAATAWLGAASGTPGEILSGLLVAGGIAWGAPWYFHKRPRGQRQRDRLLATWQNWWEFHAANWGLGGSHVIDAEEKGVTIRIRVQLWAGRQSEQDVRQVIPRIESGLEGAADAGMVRVERVKGNPSQVDLFFKRDDPLAEPVEWDPDLAPRSVHDAGLLGMDETGQWKRTPMRVNSFVNGATRAGKSNDLLVQVAQLDGCPDARTVLIDLKEGRSARPMIETGAADYVITSVAEARMYLLMAEAETAARSKWWYHGEEQAEATVEVPALFTFCDEVNPLASVASGDAECARLLGRIASQGSGLEMYLRVYTQHGSLEDSVRSEQCRANLSLRVCYRVESSAHGQFTLGKDWAKLDASVLERPGTCFAKLGPKAFPEQVRAPKMPHSLFKELMAANTRRVLRPPLKLFCGSQMSPLGVTWQEWWDRRWLRLDPAFRAISPQYAEAADEFGGAEAEMPEVEEPEAAPVTRRAAATPPLQGQESAAAVAARIAEETAGEDAVPTASAAASVADVLRSQEDRFAAALAAAGPRGASPGELVRVSGMGRTWVQDRLKALTERGALTRLKQGLYAPRPGRDVAAELAAVKAGADALLGDARRHLRVVGDSR